MTASFTEVVLCMTGCVILGGVLTLIGTVLGGWLVFRTKREALEPFFGRGQAKEDEPVNIDPLGGTYFDDLKPEPFDIVPNVGPVADAVDDEAAKLQERMTQQFLDQLARDRAQMEAKRKREQAKVKTEVKDFASKTDKKEVK